MDIRDPLKDFKPGSDRFDILDFKKLVFQPERERKEGYWDGDSSEQ